MHPLSFIRPLIATALILLIPLIGRWPWSASDFVIAGVLLFVVGMAIEAMVAKAGKYRILGVIAIVFLFVWLWAELAVGVFTNWGS